MRNARTRPWDVIPGVSVREPVTPPGKSQDYELASTLRLVGRLLSDDARYEPGGFSMTTSSPLRLVCVLD